MHLVDTEQGLMGATGVVGGNIPIALGSALATHLDGGNQATVVFFGDGAVQAADVNETVNLATLWGLPLIMVCENNGFAEFTPRSAHTNVERVSDVVAPRSARDGRRQRPARVWDASGASCLGPRWWRPVPHRMSHVRLGGTTRVTGVSRGDRGRRVAGEIRSSDSSAGLRRGWFTEATCAIEARRGRRRRARGSGARPFPLS
jgi:pyruvate dehydrogenase E1 component alpha subunit